MKFNRFLATAFGRAAQNGTNFTDKKIDHLLIKDKQEILESLHGSEEGDNVGGGIDCLSCTHLKDDDSWQILVPRSSTSEESNSFHEVLSFWRKKEKEESEKISKENGRFSISMASSELPTQKVGNEYFTQEATVIFVLGGPGSGKGTQCSKIMEHFGFTHICAGELLQSEIESGSENGEMILKFRQEGKIVPSEVTLKLLQQAMQQCENKKFVIDGFPRNEENRTAFESIMKIEPDLVLFFDCPTEVLTQRLLSRNQGRNDDNIDTIKKRLKVYFESTLPVINCYSSKGKLQKIDAQRSTDEVFEDVKSVLYKLKPKSAVGLKE